MKSLFLVYILSIPLFQPHAFGIGVIGEEPDPLDEGTYAILFGFSQEYGGEWSGAPMPINVEGNGNCILTANSSFRLKWEFNQEPPLYTIEPFISGQPEGMVLHVNNGQSFIQWHTPYVTEPTSFSFVFGIRVSDAGSVVETLNRTVVVTVSPALPFIEYSKMLNNGIRIHDPIQYVDPYAEFSIYDSDVGRDQTMTRFLDLDPRLVVERDGGWRLNWNEGYPTPLVSELLPIHLSCVDFDGEGRRTTSLAAELMIFGYDYEDSRLQPASPSQAGNWGNSVALGDTFAFIAECNVGVHVFARDGNQWEQVQTLMAPGGGEYATYIAYENGVLAVAAPYHQSSSGAYVYSAVFLYKYQEGAWTLFQTLEPGELADTYLNWVWLDFAVTDDHFTLMVSADGAESQGYHTGAAWVYEWNTVSELFEKKQEIVPVDAEANDYFGWPLALEGDLAVIAANEDDDVEVDAGAAYVYRRNSTSGLWEMEQKLTASDGSYDDYFAKRLAICEQGIFIGSYSKYDEDYDVGAVYFFQYQTDHWQETGRIKTIEQKSQSVEWGPIGPDIESNLYKFGWSIAAKDSTLLIAGQRRAPYVYKRQVVYQFDWNPVQEAWEEVRVLCATDTDTPFGLGDAYSFGLPLAISDDMILIGDPRTESDHISDAGAAFLYHRIPQPTVVEDTLETFEQALQTEAPLQSGLYQDADFDGDLNLMEFFSGTDALSEEETAVSVFQVTNDGTFSHFQFQYREGLNTSGVTPAFYCAHSLEAEAWYHLDAPLFIEDVLGEGYRIRTLDLSEEVLDGQPLFIKMKLILPE